MDTPLTKRQLQALHTKQHILDVSVKLMGTYGYGQVKISQICKEADVSIGCFYHHFKTKSDLLIGVFNRFAHHISSFITHELQEKDAIESILSLMGYHAQYVTQIGSDIVTQVYIAQLIENYETILSEVYNPTEVLNTYIQLGQQTGQLISHMPSLDLANLLITHLTGIVYNWCVCNGSYNLVEEVENTFTLLLKCFKPCET